MWRKCVGATLLEFAVTASVLGILAFVLLDRMTYYQERAEKANMEYTVATVKTALLVEFSTLMVEGRMQESPALLLRNPMDWLVPKPANYLGEFNGIAPDDELEAVPEEVVRGLNSEILRAEEYLIKVHR